MFSIKRLKNLNIPPIANLSSFTQQLLDYSLPSSPGNIQLSGKPLELSLE
jgi:hypothetical protein